jgi:hypothetical protein
MSQYLELLRLAFKAVNKSYFSFYAFRFSNEQFAIDPKSFEEYEQHVERNFAYELYHQYRLLMEKDANRELFNGLQLNGETPKIGFNDTIIGKNVIIPDLVLHKSQLNIEEANQKLFVEVKINENADLGKDIAKLLFAVMPPLSFQEGVLICINISFADVKNQIRNYPRIKRYPEVLKKIFLLHPDLEDYKSFDEIINNEQFNQHNKIHPGHHA